jgi:hypothetical protein
VTWGAQGQFRTGSPQQRVERNVGFPPIGDIAKVRFPDGRLSVRFRATCEWLLATRAKGRPPCRHGAAIRGAAFAGSIGAAIVASWADSKGWTAVLRRFAAVRRPRLNRSFTLHREIVA